MCRSSLHPNMQWIPIWMLRLFNVGFVPFYLGCYVWIAVRQTVECVVVNDAYIRKVDDAVV